jgi:hypothetical protein
MIGTLERQVGDDTWTHSSEIHEDIVEALAGEPTAYCLICSGPVTGHYSYSSNTGEVVHDGCEIPLDAWALIG